MIVEKLVKSSILDALDIVWSDSGIIPSKKTRKSILRAAEKISGDVEEDLRRAGKTRSQYGTSGWMSATRITKDPTG